MFENRVLWKVFGRKTNEATGECRRLNKSRFMNCTLHQILFGRLNKEERIWRGMWRAGGRGEVHRGG